MDVDVLLCLHLRRWPAGFGTCSPRRSRLTLAAEPAEVWRAEARGNGRARYCGRRGLPSARGKRPQNQSRAAGPGRFGFRRLRNEATFADLFVPVRERPLDFRSLSGVAQVTRGPNDLATQLIISVMGVLVTGALLCDECDGRQARRLGVGSSWGVSWTMAPMRSWRSSSPGAPSYSGSTRRG